MVNVATGSTGELKVQNNGTDVLQIGSAGQLQLDVQGSSGGILFGTDTNLYRSAASTLMTDDAFTSAGLLTGQAGATITGGNLNVTGHILPGADDTYDLGSDSARWRDLYLGPATLHVGTSTSDEGAISYNTTSNNLTFGATNGSVFQNSANSTTAFQIQNAVGSSLFTVDTANSIIRPGVVAVTTSFSRTSTTVDSTNDVGYYTSIAIGTDGLPIISYFDDTNDDLKTLKCGNSACSSGNTTTTVDSTGTVGQYTSIAIGTDGLPIISYFDYSTSGLKTLKCGNSACSSGNTITTVDTTTGAVDLDNSIAIGTDGLPIISYFDDTNDDLKTLKCGNSACSSGNTITTVDTTGTVGQYTSIAIGTDGLPIISYYDKTNADLKTLKCGNSACSSGNTITTVDTTGDVGIDSSIAIGTDGLPIISYFDNSTDGLKTLKCGNSACSSGNTITTVDTTTGAVVLDNSIAIGTDGLPIISHYDKTNGDLKTVKCGNSACSSGNTTTTVDSTGDVGQHSSIAIGTDGLPIISYYDTTNGDLRSTKCSDGACSGSSGSSYGGGVTLGTASSAFQSLYFDTLNLGKEDAKVRLDQNGNFVANGLSAKSNGTIAFNLSSSTSAFNIQDNSGTMLLSLDSTNDRIALGPGASPANGVLTVGTDTTTASGGMYFGTDTNLYRYAANGLKTDDSLWVANNLVIGAYAAATAVHLCTNWGVVATCTGSSINYKENIRPLTTSEEETALNVITGSNVYEYDYKHGYAQDDTSKHKGIIAEELPEELTVIDERGNRTPNREAFADYLWIALGQLSRKSNGIDSNVSLQGSRISDLDSQLTQIGSQLNTSSSSLTSQLGSVNSKLSQLNGKVEILQNNSGNYLENGDNASFTNLNVGGLSQLNNLSVTGTAQVNKLTVAEDATIQGKLTVGSINTGTITVAGHIITRGDAPIGNVLPSAGNDAEVSINGNDTAGSITITTGTQNLNSGDLAEIIFNKHFDSSPRVILSAQDEASIDAKIFPSDKATDKFMLKTGQVLTANTSYTFDYFIIE